MKKPKYEWVVVQEGQLPIGPDGTRVPLNKHRPTSIVLYPAGKIQGNDRFVLTDPYISDGNYAQGASSQKGIPVRLNDIKWIFITHQHADHMPLSLSWNPKLINSFIPDRYPGLSIVNLPGHHPDLMGLIFMSTSNKIVGVVGDAVIDQNWLMAWQYFWPNGYLKNEIIDTWNSVAWIVSNVDIIVPGHGPSFEVTTSLVHELLNKFPAASHADLCPNVKGLLTGRLEQLSRD